MACRLRCNLQVILTLVEVKSLLREHHDEPEEGDEAHL